MRDAMVLQTGFIEDSRLLYGIGSLFCACLDTPEDAHHGRLIKERQ